MRDVSGLRAVASMIPDLPFAALVAKVEEDGSIMIEVDGAEVALCDLLQVSVTPIKIAPGDHVLVLPMQVGARPVVLGRIGKNGEDVSTASTMEICATRQISLVCGAGRIDLHSDGKVLIKGEDVTVRAKGTQRIRAGTVSIN